MKKEVKAGIFVVLMIGALWAGIRFLKGFDIFSRNTVYYAVYDAVDGLSHAAPVLIQGVKVGTVTGIGLNPERSDKVVLQLTVKRQYHLPKDSEARIFSNSLMGSKAVGIELGHSGEVLGKGDTIRSGVTRDLMDVAGSELDFFKGKLSIITADLSRTMGNLNSIMERNANGIDGTIAHLDALSGRLNGLLEPGKGDLARSLKSVSVFLAGLERSTPRLERTLASLEKTSGDIAAADLRKTLDELGLILARIERGEGTLGRLSADPALYESLDAAARDLSVLLKDVEHYPGRYISVFGGARRKAEKQRARDLKQAADTLAAAQ